MVNNCAFCDRSKFDERIVAENDLFWIIATLGQITDGGYLLLVPKKHIKCMGALTAKEFSLALDLTFKINCVLALEYQQSLKTNPYPVAVFEHGIVGQTVKHAHWHFIPEVMRLTSKIHDSFPNAECEELKYAAHLRGLYSERKEPYLMWVSGGEAVVFWNPPAPPQYLRIVVADELGRPERANWRNMDPELDKKLWSETVRRLKPYFK